MHDRNPVAPALLAGGDRDLLPMTLARRGALALGARHPPGGEHRPDLGDAELDRLADGEFHALPGGDALHQHDMERRFALDGAMLPQVPAELQSLNLGKTARLIPAPAP